MKDTRTYNSDTEKEQVEERNKEKSIVEKNSKMYEVLSPMEMQFACPFFFFNEHILYFYNKKAMP